MAATISTCHEQTRCTALQPGNFRTVRGRMLFWILAVTIPIYAGALYMSYQATAQRLEAGAERDADELAARLAAGLDAVIRPIEGGIRTVAHQLEEVIRRASSTRSAFAASSRRGRMSTDRRSPSRSSDDDPLRSRSRLTTFGAATRSPSPIWRSTATDIASCRGIAARPMRGAPVWSPPYFDAGGGETWMVTYSVPFFRTLADARARARRRRDRGSRSRLGAASTAASVPLGPFGVGWLASPPGRRSFVAPIGDTAGRIAARPTADASRRFVASAKHAREGHHLRTAAGGVERRARLSRRAQSRDARLAADARHSARRSCWPSARRCCIASCGSARADCCC